MGFVFILLISNIFLHYGLMNDISRDLNMGETFCKSIPNTKTPETGISDGTCFDIGKKRFGRQNCEKRFHVPVAHGMVYELEVTTKSRLTRCLMDVVTALSNLIRDFTTKFPLQFQQFLLTSNMDLCVE